MTFLYKVVSSHFVTAANTYYFSEITFSSVNLGRIPLFIDAKLTKTSKKFLENIQKLPCGKFTALLFILFCWGN